MAKDSEKYVDQLAAPMKHTPQVSAGAPVRHGCLHLYHPIAQGMDPHSQGRLNSKSRPSSQFSPNRPPHGPLAGEGLGEGRAAALFDSPPG